MLYPLLLGLGALALCVYIREKTRACTVKTVFLKSAVSVLFIAVSAYGTWLCAVRGRMVPLCPLVLLGQVLGLLGDVWLDLKYAFPEKDAPFTRAGFFSFGAGHVLFIIGLLLSRYPAGRPMTVILPLLLSALLSFGNAAMEKPMKLCFGEYRTTVIVYGALLFSTVLLSGSFALAGGFRDTPLNLFFAGAVLFAASDLILSGTYFGVGRDRPVDLALNYLTYYPAQFLIASSLVFLA